jgi:hypothetical protein
MSKWLDKLKEYAPSIASAVLSGGATLPQLALKAIADATGEDIQNETQLSAFVKNADPETMLKIQQANQSFEVELEKLSVERLKIVNSTMQTEAQSDKWWVSGWRPFIGYITGVAFLVCVIFVCCLAYKGIVDNDTNAMAMIPQMITSFTMLFGIPGAILGIASHHRGHEKRAKALGK